MISQRTIFSLLLTLLLMISIYAWSGQHRDECTAYLRGDLKAPATQAVDVGRGAIDVPCTSWLPRQPRGVQVLCLLDVALGVVFALSVWDDRMRARGRQSQR